MQLPLLLEYKRWANALLFEATARLSAESIHAPQKIVFGSLINTLHHVYTVDKIFEAHLTGTEHGLTTRRPETSPPLQELGELQKRADLWYLDYVHSLSESAACEVIEFEFIGGGKGAMSRENIVFHIVNHGTYHRGHIGTMFYEFSTEPPTTDFPVFLREQQ